MKYIIFVFLLVSFSSVAISQEIKDLTSYPGKWIYTNNNLSNEWFSEKFYKMNATELQKYHSTTEKLVNYLHQQPVAQNPLGATLNVESRASYDSYDHASKPVKPNERVKAEIYIPFCRITAVKGKFDFDCTEVSYIKLRTNDVASAFESAMTADNLNDKQAQKQYNEIIILPKKLLDLGGGIYLYDGYYQNRIVVTNNNSPFWLPITNKEYTSRMLAYYTATVKEGLQPQMVLDALKSEISAIPAEMMMMPAYINGINERPLTRICTMEEDSTSALYKINHGYFDPSLPRTAVQLITISIEGHADDADWGEINAHRVWEFIQGLKGSDLRKLLDVN
jgi:hypothetical protein